MSFGTRLKARREQLGITQPQLAELLGVSKGAIGNYETDANSPKATILFKVFDVLKCDANYLFQDEMKELSAEDRATPYEMENLVKKYRALDEHGKRTVNYILEQETVRTTQLQEASAGSNDNTTPVRLINYYYRLASAGTGQILFDMPPTKKIQIPDTPKNRRADYAIGVNGDSMEPVYHDGETLLVEMTEEISVGDIGIFSVNNECFVKKLGEDKLISLNPDSPNIPLNESARCMGKVIDRL